MNNFMVTCQHCNKAWSISDFYNSLQKEVTFLHIEDTNSPNNRSIYWVEHRDCGVQDFIEIEKKS